MAKKYAVGDQVQLKSGGPDMTVKQAFPNNEYRCQWFAGKKLEWGDFLEDTLQPVAEKSS